MLDHVDRLVCRKCGEELKPARRARCPECADGGALRHVYRTRELAPFDRSVWARREPWLWRFRELLPLDDDFDPPPLQVGMTPLYGSPRLAGLCGVRGLFVKDESRHPTGRTRDRAGALLVADALRSQQPIVSAGLADAVAPFAASAGHLVLAVGSASDPLALALGARPLLLDPALDPLRALLQLQLAGYALADRPHPLAFEGLKTLGLEIGDQLAERLPDWVVVDGREPELVEAVEAGLAQCAELGLFRRAPQVLAVDGAGGDAQAQAVDDLAELAVAARRALGLPIVESGVRGLSGLRQAVKQGLVPAEALALVVVEGRIELPAATLSSRQPVRDYEGLRAAADELARAR